MSKSTSETRIMAEGGSRRRLGTPPRASETAGDHRVAVLDRAASLLMALAQSTRPTSLADAAKHAGLSKATAFRILATLIEEGLVVQDEATSSYRLGVAPMRLATAVLAGVPFHAVARRAMREVCDTLNETVVLSVMDGDTRVNIDAVECTNAIGSSNRIGEPRPLHAGAASRVLLATRPDAEIEAYLERTRPVGKPGTRSLDVDKLWKEIRTARRTGFASSSAEISPDSHAVAAVISTPDGAAIAAIHVAIPLGRYSARVEARCRQALARAVRAIERELGRG